MKYTLMEKFIQEVIKNLKCLKTRYTIMVLVVFITLGCSKKEANFYAEFESILTSDSIGYWNFWPYEYRYGVKQGPIHTYGFKKDGTLEYYRMVFNGATDTIGEHLFICLNTSPSPPSFLINKWVVKKDSVFEMMGVHSYKIIKYSNDTIIIKPISDFGEPYKGTMGRYEIFYRFKENNLRLDEESKRLKDSLDRW